MIYCVVYAAHVEVEDYRTCYVLFFSTSHWKACRFIGAQTHLDMLAVTPNSISLCSWVGVTE